MFWTQFSYPTNFKLPTPINKFDIDINDIIDKEFRIEWQS